MCFTQWFTRWLTTRCSLLAGLLTIYCCYVDKVLVASNVFHFKVDSLLSTRWFVEPFLNKTLVACYSVKLLSTCSDSTKDSLLFIPATIFLLVTFHSLATLYSETFSILFLFVQVTAYLNLLLHAAFHTLATLH